MRGILFIDLLGKVQSSLRLHLAKISHGSPEAMLVKPSSTSPLPNEPVFRLNVKFWEICSKGSCWKIFCSCTALLKHEHLYSHMISKEFPDPKSCFFLGSGVLDLFGIFVGDLKHTIYPNMCIIRSIHLLQVLLYRVTVATRMTFPQRYKNPRQMVCSTTTTTYTSAKTNMSPEK